MDTKVGRSIVIAGMLAVVGATLVASADLTSAVPRAELLAISAKLDATVSTVMIEATAPVAYVTSQPDPLTVLVDLRNVGGGVMAAPIAPMPPVQGVDVEDLVAPDGAPMARIRVRLDRTAAHRVHSARNVIYVDVDRSSPLSKDAKDTKVAKGTKDTKDTAQGATYTAPVADAPTAPVKAESPAPAAAETPVPAKKDGAAAKTAAARAATTLIGVRALPSGSGIAIRGNGQLTAATVEEAKDMPPRVLLDFKNVSGGRVPAVTNVNEGVVQRVRVGVNSRSPLITRVVVDLVKKIAFRVEEAGEELRVWFEGSGATGATGATVISDTSANAPGTEPIPSSPAFAVTDAAPATTSGSGAAPQDTPATAVATLGAMTGQQPVPPPPTSATPPEPPAQRFTGNPVSLDFQGADLRAVLRTFAEISGLNIVIDPSINGTVDVSLRDVPWDQALDIILRANKLGYAVDGTVVRIAPLTVLAQEQEERRKLTEAQALSGELRVLTLPLSYAKADQLVPILTRSALSSRGEVQVDSRTNTLIIRDLGDRLQTASDLVKALDRPQPQVEIEARIVQTTRDFARSLGVQWGFNGRVDPALGNTTNLAFPNNGSLRGGLGGAQGPGEVERGVNLGVAAPTSALGIALGSINGAVNLDVVLSALERSGRGRLLSTPRVSTQNNVEAEMTQGLQIPIQTVANNTVTVSFKDAALILRVTPQITAANTVIMRVFLENATPDFSRAVNGIPPIDTQRALTSVLVADGETTVIGGIYVSREQATQGRVPMLHRVPLLGWLFKRDEFADESRELLIFITPRITRS